MCLWRIQYLDHLGVQHEVFGERAAVGCTNDAMEIVVQNLIEGARADPLNLSTLSATAISAIEIVTIECAPHRHGHSKTSN